jgi:hypothetical protein
VTPLVWPPYHSIILNKHRLPTFQIQLPSLHKSLQDHPLATRRLSASRLIFLAAMVSACGYKECFFGMLFLKNTSDVFDAKLIALRLHTAAAMPIEELLRCICGSLSIQCQAWIDKGLSYGKRLDHPAHITSYRLVYQRHVAHQSRVLRAGDQFV